MKRLAQLLREAPEIGSIEVKGWFGTGVVITRTAPRRSRADGRSHAGLALPALRRRRTSAAGGSRAAAAPAAHLKEIRSPMVGTFYKAPEPGAEPYIKVGNRVTAGQTVCIIEAMKIMNEIEAEITGVVREISVEDCPAGRVRTGPLPGGSEWLRPKPPPPTSTFNFKQTIAQMVQRNASDLLLKVGRPPTVRLNGDLQGLEMPPVKPEDLKLLAEQIMTPRQVKEFSERKEADFAIGVPGVGRFRTNIYQQRGTLAFAFRAIPYEVKTVRELHLPAVLEEIALRPRGLVLITGITGSGKSTALASMINHVNQNRRVNVITIEDPIEFLHRDVQSNISQREVGNDTLSFGSALCVTCCGRTPT